MIDVRLAVQRHPQVVDAVFALLLTAALVRVTADIGGTEGWEWAWFCALPVPLVWRRRWPVAVFWTVIGLAFAAVGTGVIGPALLVVPMIAAYSVARHGPRRRLWWAVVPVAPFLVGWLSNGGPLWDAIALVTMFAGSLLLGHALQAREREHDQAARLAIAAERVRIAREMHDIVAHNLAVMVALADGAVATAPAGAGQSVDLMEKVSVTGRAALADVRRLVGLLREPAAQPGLDDLAELVSQVRTAGLRVTLTSTGTPAGGLSGAGLAAYRIVQEALTNTMKHAGPGAEAAVRVRHHRTGLEVEIVDDGGGHRAALAEGPAGGHGLTGMAERAARFGGRVEAGPRPEGGWRVRASLSRREMPVG